ncbi:DMP19 family protein [Paenibacillus sp. S-38]|uniref:DMP19 family protein n=1 Tax=Paenibacillus sp. S-38 TaxID=3416710 RepID=UPI003CEAA74C
MESTRELVKSLLPEHELNALPSIAIIDHIGMNIYKSNYTKLRDKEIFIQLPVVLQDIILILDFDIELQMNGIIGFLENSTGTYFEETIQALFRISATKDFEIMKDIKSLLISNGINTLRLRENLIHLSQYQVTNSRNIHGKELSELLSEVASLADHLYLYRDNDNIFDHLFSYFEKNKAKLNEYINWQSLK